jgi:hypothetical protein
MSISAHVRGYLRQHHVALVALFFALAGGTAYALDGSNTVFSDDIVNDEVRSSDLRDGQVFGVDLKDNSVTGADVANNNSLGPPEIGELGADEIADGSLTGTEIADGTITGSDVDEASLNGVAGVFARADNSFAPGNPSRLELFTPDLGASLIVLCEDGGTPGTDADDTVSIGLNNLGPAPIQVISERSTAGGGGGVSSHDLDRLELPTFSGTGSIASKRQTMKFLVSPLGDSSTTLVAEVAGATLDPGGAGDDNCSGVIQATQSG